MKHSRRRSRAALIPAAIVLGILVGQGACSRRNAPPPDEFAGVTQFVANPSFEEMDGERPAGWMPRPWRPEAEFKVDTLAHSGARSVMIASGKGADASWLASRGSSSLCRMGLIR